MKKLLLITLILVSFRAFSQTDAPPTAPIAKPITSYWNISGSDSSLYLYVNAKWVQVVGRNWLNSHSGGLYKPAQGLASYAPDSIGLGGNITKAINIPFVGNSASLYIGANNKTNFSMDNAGNIGFGAYDSRGASTIGSQGHMMQLFSIVGGQYQGINLNADSAIIFQDPNLIAPRLDQPGYDFSDPLSFITRGFADSHYSTGSYAFSNGITNTSGAVKLGGTLGNTTETLTDGTNITWSESGSGSATSVGANTWYGTANNGLTGTPATYAASVYLNQGIGELLATDLSRPTQPMGIYLNPEPGNQNVTFSNKVGNKYFAYDQFYGGTPSQLAILPKGKLDSLYAPISGGGYMPLSGGNFTGKVSQIFSQTITSSGNAFTISPNITAGANNIQYPMLYIGGSFNSAGYTGTSSVSISTAGSIQDANNLYVNGTIFNSVTQIGFPATADTLEHYWRLNDTLGRALISAHNTGDVRIGRTVTDNGYAFTVDGATLFNNTISVSAQSATPTPPPVNTNLIYANPTGIITFMGHNGFGLSLGKGHLTASHKLEAQNKDYTIADSADVAALSTALNNQIVQNYYYTGTGSEGTTATISSLVGMTINGVWRSGLKYRVTTGTVTANKYSFNSGTGAFTFSDAIGSSENIDIQYTAAGGSPSSTANTIYQTFASYAAMQTYIATALTNVYYVFYVDADTNNTSDIGVTAQSLYTYYNGTLIFYQRNVAH